MGCDIHIHAEIKVKGKWRHYDQPNCSRDYELFERMAGVRGDDENAIATPRGIPEDASFTTKFDAERHWGSDGHSHSWISSSEIFELKKWECKRSGNEFPECEWDRYLFGNHYSDFHKCPDERQEGVEDIRFVFWFDN